MFFSLNFITLAVFGTLCLKTTAEGLDHRCPGAKLVANTTIEVGGHEIEYTSHYCGTQTIERRGFLGFLEYPPWCFFFRTCKKKFHPPHHSPPPPPPPPPKDVCDVICSTSCNGDAGVLPPISDDCQTIEDAIQIFQGQTTTFVVDPNHLETLTFGTCSYFFENTGDEQLQYCWSDLSIEGSAAGSACFPPVQPFFSEGLCSAADGTWAVGAAHS